MVQGAADVDAAVRALSVLAAELLADLEADIEESVNFVVGPVRSPMGPFVMMDAHSLGSRAWGELPDRLVGLLDEQGASDAVVVCPAGRDPYRYRQWGMSVALLAAPAVPEGLWLTDVGRVPSDWLELAIDFLAAQPFVGGDAEVTIGSEVEVSLPLAEAGVVLEGTHAQGMWASVAAGRLPEQVAVVGVGSSSHPVLSVGLGGTSLTPATAAASARLLADLARSWVDASYAVVVTEPDWHAVIYLMPGAVDDFSMSVGSPTGFCCYSTLPDAHWWQLLSRGHLEELGGVWPEGAVVVGPGRAEVQVGEPEEWWPNQIWRQGYSPAQMAKWMTGLVPRYQAGQPTSNAGVRFRARALLAPLLVPDESPRASELFRRSVERRKRILDLDAP